MNGVTVSGPTSCMQTAVMKSDGDGDEPEFRGGGFCAISQSKLLAELEPTTPVARWEETLSLGKCPRVLVGKSQGCTIQKQALGGSPDRMDSLKDLGPMRTKIPVFLLVGQISGWGSSLKWTGAGLWFGCLARIPEAQSSALPCSSAKCKSDPLDRQRCSQGKPAIHQRSEGALVKCLREVKIWLNQS